MSTITFGEPTGLKFDTNETVAQGGRINTSVPVLRDGVQVATANIGAWVYTDRAANNGVSSDIADAVRRSGWAIGPYSGEDRNLTILADDTTGDDIAAALGDDSDTPAETVILDAAEAYADIDYADIYADALRRRLGETGNDSVYALVRAAAELDGVGSA